MWLLLLLFLARAEQVVSQGDENRLILRNDVNKMNPCEGHVEVYYNGQQGYVGDSIWNEHNEELVCKSTHCGSAKNSTDYALRPVDSRVLLDEINCTGKEEKLWECPNPGWNVSEYRKDFVKMIKCTNEINIKLDEFRCAGAVTYSITGKQEETGYLCADNWGEKEAQLLCETLDCGGFKEIPKAEYLSLEKFKDPKNKKMLISCSGISDVTHLWQCATGEVKTKQNKCQNPASVICTAHKRLQLRDSSENVCSGILEINEKDEWSSDVKLTGSPDDWCKQMYCGQSNSSVNQENGKNLTCSESVKVVLMDNNESSKCYGEVFIEKGKWRSPVCGSEWTDKNAEMVCKELKCGKLIRSQTRGQSAGGIMDYVSCSGNESSLWHCRAKHASKPLQCSSKAYVVCEDSLDVKLMDGPGKCAGRVEIQYGGKWQRVQKDGWNDKASNFVCKKLECGKQRQLKSADKFSQGSGEFLAVDCKKEAANIRECTITPNQRQTGNQEAVGITCEKQKVVFLDGEESCAGIVNIEYDKTYQLSGSTQTWNRASANTVCRQMNCGSADNYTFTSSVNKTVWNESYSCSSDNTSLFDCEKKEKPDDHNTTVAKVKCSGSITVNLTGRCSGNVNICIGDKCGGVTKGSWMDKYSQMLCENLGCGTADLNAKPQVKKNTVLFKSLHIPAGINNLNLSNFVKCGKNDETCEESSAYVVCSDSFETRINASREKCSGNVEVNYGGQWLPVCKEALEDEDSKNIICREQNCGDALSTLEHFKPMLSSQPVISKIQCPQGANSAKACEITSEVKSCQVVGLQCSKWRRTELKFGTACSGAVFVHWEGDRRGDRSAVSGEGITETEGNRLCQDLNCGNVTSMRNKTNMMGPFWNASFSCGDSNNIQSLWDCEKPASPTRQQLHITCKDEPHVTFTETCGGQVKINGISVCWEKDFSHLVCKDKGCGNAILNNTASKEDTCYHVFCEKYHYKLGQCRRWLSKGNAKSVYCTGGVNFKTSERCGGTIQIKYKNNWENMCPLDSSLNYKTQLCQKLGCDSHNASVSDQNQVTFSMKTQVKCGPNHKDISYCISTDNCQKPPAEVYCKGYVESVRVTPPSTPVVPIILGVGFLLVVVILIVVFVRVYIVRKAKRSMNSSSMIRREDEFESGDYEDVANKGDKMDMDFSRGRFRSEAEVMMEGDAHSTASLPYDDIDEVAEAQPLTGRDATAGAPGDNFINGVVYEGDDPLENYDDIEAGPAVVETQAEVHDRPQAPPESAAVAPPGLGPREEDYLVPGQDG